MKKSLVALVLSFAVSATAFAAVAVDPVITCSLQKPNKPAVKDTVSLTLNEEEVFGESSGINVGRKNYSYGLGTTKKDGKVELEVIFYENNYAMDEVGSHYCTYDPQIHGTKMFCKEPINDDNGKLILQFSCIAN